VDIKKENDLQSSLVENSIFVNTFLTAVLQSFFFIKRVDGWGPTHN